MRVLLGNNKAKHVQVANHSDQVSAMEGGSQYSQPCLIMSFPVLEMKGMTPDKTGSLSKSVQLSQNYQCHGVVTIWTFSVG